MPDTRRAQEMLELYQSGYTAEEVGRQFAVSHQRVFQIIGPRGERHSVGWKLVRHPPGDLGHVSDYHLAHEMAVDVSTIRRARKTLGMAAAPLAANGNNSCGKGGLGEARVLQRLLEIGIAAERTPSNAPFDILVSKHVRIDVKTCTKIKQYTSRFAGQIKFKVGQGQKRGHCDFYVLVVTDPEAPGYFVIPSSSVPPMMGYIIFAWPMRSNRGRPCPWTKYRDRWDLIVSQAKT